MTDTATAPSIKVWGDPAGTAFRKRLIRIARSGESSVLVHKDMVGPATGLLDGLAAAGYTLPVGELPGYTDDPSLPPTHPARWGLAIGINLAGLGENAHDVAVRWRFETVGAHVVYVGDPAEAEDAHERAMAARVAEATKDLPPVGDYYAGKPGTRDVEPGARGDDVLVLQYVLGAGDRDGIYGASLRQAIIDFQRRHNLPENGIVEVHTWSRILPRRRMKVLNDGDAGREVILLQACLIAYGWWPDGRLTGRFGSQTTRVVRRMQDEYGLRTNGAVRLPEWSILLDTSDWYKSDNRASGGGLDKAI